jgi:hypothetical protein
LATQNSKSVDSCADLRIFEVAMNAASEPLKPFLMDPYWRKARIAARILLRRQSGSLNDRDRRLAARLADDPGVTNRLVDQALSSITARKNYGSSFMGWFGLSRDPRG